MFLNLVDKFAQRNRRWQQKKDKDERVSALWHQVELFCFEEFNQIMLEMSAQE